MYHPRLGYGHFQRDEGGLLVVPEYVWQAVGGGGVLSDSARDERGRDRAGGCGGHAGAGVNRNNSAVAASNTKSNY